MKVKGLVMAISCLLSRFKAYITCCFNCGKTYEKFDKFRRKHRYAYGSIFDKKMKILGVAKFDLALEPELNTRDLKVGGNVVGLFVHGDGRSGSEPLFVPRVVDKEIPEDDGYLVCFVYDENKGYVFLTSFSQLLQFSLKPGDAMEHLNGGISGVHLAIVEKILRS
jgi:hypothetical protein